MQLHQVVLPYFRARKVATMTFRSEVEIRELKERIRELKERAGR